MTRGMVAGLVVVLALVPGKATAQEGENGASVSFTVDEALAKRGKSVFQNKGCGACHALGRRGAGPDLVGVTERRDHAWLASFMKDPTPMLETDSTAIEMLREFRGAKMPNLRLTDADVQALMHYLAQETAKRRSN